MLILTVTKNYCLKKRIKRNKWKNLTKNLSKEFKYLIRKYADLTIKYYNLL